MERCWKIHGYPTNYKPNTWRKDPIRKANAAHNNTRVEERYIEPKLTQEQYNKLMCLLNTQPDHNNNKEPSMAASTHLEGKLCLNVLKHSRWILDSGTSDHICCDISLFKKHDVLIGKQNTIIIPGGAQVRVKFIGTV